MYQSIFALSFLIVSMLWIPYALALHEETRQSIKLTQEEAEQLMGRLGPDAMRGPWTREYDKRQVTAYRPERQLWIYETMDYRANRLRVSPHGHIVDVGLAPSGQNQVILIISDRDRDGTADEFAYLTDPQKQVEDFGFMFDLDKNGQFDYIVFNGGPMVSQRPTGKAMYWMNYHWIDSNGDGRIDIVVDNDIDRDSDSLPELGVTAWIYDEDYDGYVDSSEFLGYTASFPIAGDVWQPGRTASLKEEIGDGSDVLMIPRVMGSIEFRRHRDEIPAPPVLEEVTALLASPTPRVDLPSPPPGPSPILEQQVRLKSFSVNVPSDARWELRTRDNGLYMQLTERTGFFNRFARLRSIQVYQYTVPPDHWHLSALEAADDFRMSERIDMLWKGVLKGMYQLRDLRLGRWSVGELNLYYMRYTTEAIESGETLLGDGLLLLLFPQDYEAHHNFYMFHFADICDVDICGKPSVDLALARAVIESAQLR
ncbi:MAG: hypothetical protein GWO29_01410 [Gammaproteobacteria bacterium]|nr:hypothetical protein [Gammaproteobacteria bacterium]NIR21933.1 hypothetical protein [Gammaproteobacteria bacterium]NIS03629.1 hypothetical protein [Gammaproteobacteria bacterium]NIV45567.1 hypothetical protein [Gammaproteobacteria bacterium]NIX02954.1 hypothetical protein [Gammaproteobacteria bacterium]